MMQETSREVTIAAYKILDEYPIPILLFAEATYWLRGREVIEETYYSLSVHVPNWEGEDTMLCEESQQYVLELIELTEQEALKDLQEKLDDNLAEEIYEDPWYDGDWPQLCRQFKSEKAWKEEEEQKKGRD